MLQQHCGVALSVVRRFKSRAVAACVSTLLLTDLDICFFAAQHCFACASECCPAVATSSCSIGPDCYIVQPCQYCKHALQLTCLSAHNPVVPVRCFSLNWWHSGFCRRHSTVKAGKVEQVASGACLPEAEDKVEQAKQIVSKFGIGFAGT